MAKIEKNYNSHCWQGSGKNTDSHINSYSIAGGQFANVYLKLYVCSCRNFTPKKKILKHQGLLE